jgi:hypothetical protein
MTDDGIDPAHPLIRASISVLENFHEAYWIAARTIRDSRGADGISEKSLIDEQRTRTTPRACCSEKCSDRKAPTIVLFKNALSRFSELGFIKIKSGSRGRRERKIARGQNVQSSTRSWKSSGAEFSAAGCRRVLDVTMSDQALREDLKNAMLAKDRVRTSVCVASGGGQEPRHRAQGDVACPSRSWLRSSGARSSSATRLWSSRDRAAAAKPSPS